MLINPASIIEGRQQKVINQHVQNKFLLYRMKYNEVILLFKFIINRLSLNSKVMDKEDLNNDNQLDMGFIADQSRQPVSQGHEFSEDRSISGISYLNTPNLTSSYSNFQHQISGLQSWPAESINFGPKRNCSIKQENQSYQQQENSQKLTKKKLNDKLKIICTKPNSTNYQLRKKSRICYNEKSGDSADESDQNQIRLLVSQMKEKPKSNRNFKKIIAGL